MAKNMKIKYTKNKSGHIKYIKTDCPHSDHNDTFAGVKVGSRWRSACDYNLNTLDNYVICSYIYGFTIYGKEYKRNTRLK